MAFGAVWVPVTLLASSAQTLRNAMQRDLIGALGAVGAAQVRFLFGLPFAARFLVGLLAVTGLSLPRLTALNLGWTAFGATSQVIATAMMLAAMRTKSFVAAVAYTKTEAAQIALFSLIALSDPPTVALIAAIVLATIGVAVMALKMFRERPSLREGLGMSLIVIAGGSSSGLRRDAARGANSHPFRITQMIDGENYKAKRKNSKQRRRSFFVAGDLAHVPNSPNMHFSTSNVSGKGKNRRRLATMSQAVEKMRIYPSPSGSPKNKKEAGSRRAARRPGRAETPGFRISRVELTGSFSAVNRDLFSLKQGAFLAEQGLFRRRAAIVGAHPDGGAPWPRGGYGFAAAGGPSGGRLLR